MPSWLVWILGGLGWLIGVVIFSGGYKILVGDTGSNPVEDHPDRFEPKT